MNKTLISQLSPEQIKAARECLQWLNAARQLHPGCRPQPPHKVVSNDMVFGTSLPMFVIEEMCQIDEAGRILAGLIWHIRIVPNNGPEGIYTIDEFLAATA